MEKTNIGEINHDSIVDAIVMCKQATVEIKNLIDKNVLNDAIENKLNYVFDGLWKLIFTLYPIETLEQDKLNDLYAKFLEYLENNTNSIESFFEVLENMINE